MRPRTAPIVVALLLAACSEGSEIDLRIYGEPFAEEGIGAEEFADGWSIEFESLLIAVHDVAVGEDSVAVQSAVYDLARRSDGLGHALTTAPSGEAGLTFRVAAPTQADSTGNATPQQVDRMREEGLAVLAIGVAAREDQRLRFELPLAIDMTYACNADASGGGDVELTVHVDHLFVDDLALDAALRFDAFADADADGSGDVTATELQAVDITTMPRYQGGGDETRDLWGFIGRAAVTTPHVDGEGPCAQTFTPRGYTEDYDAERFAPDAARGAASFAEHCASCHGADGEVGPAGADLVPRPTDLTRLTGGAAQPAYIHFRVAEGGRPFPYASAMPALGDALADDEVADIVAYVGDLAR